jgi:hypothetical protein
MYLIDNAQENFDFTRLITVPLLIATRTYSAVSDDAIVEYRQYMYRLPDGEFLLRYACNHPMHQGARNEPDDYILEELLTLESVFDWFRRDSHQIRRAVIDAQQ